MSNGSEGLKINRPKTATATLPFLHATMKACHLTNERLAVISGICCRTISEARRGGRVKPSSAAIIEQAVYIHARRGR